MEIDSAVKFLEGVALRHLKLAVQKSKVLTDLDIELAFLYLLQLLSQAVDEVALLVVGHLPNPSLDNDGCPLRPQ